MKKILKYIVIPLVSILLFLNVTILLCLNVTSIQEWIVGGITKTLSEKTNTKIAIGQFQLDLFDGVFVSDLLVEDLNKDTLAFVKRMNVGYSLKTIYRKETLTLKGLHLRILKLNLPPQTILQTTTSNSLWMRSVQKRLTKTLHLLNLNWQLKRSIFKMVLLNTQ